MPLIGEETKPRHSTKIPQDRKDSLHTGNGLNPVMQRTEEEAAFAEVNTTMYNSWG